MLERVKDQYLPWLERALTPARLRHSLGVMAVMAELAAVYGLDEEQAVSAGLLHDAAKDLPADQVARLVAQANIACHEPCEQDYVLYLHGPVGAAVIEREMGVTDRAVLDAVYRHTWMGEYQAVEPALVWCLRFADLLEPNRRWNDEAHSVRAGMPRLRAAVYAGQMEEAAWIEAGLLIAFYEETGRPVHSNCRRMFRELGERLGE